MIVCLYFFTIFSLLPISFIFTRPLTLHGRISSGISKNYFVLFYIYGLILNIVLNINLYAIHLLRRSIECTFLKYKKSKMTLLQLIHGFIYYSFVVFHLKDKEFKNRFVFILLNLAQSFYHTKIFRYKTMTYNHYYAEFLIYLYIFNEVRTIEMFFNLCYVLSFIIVTKINRKTCDK